MKLKAMVMLFVFSILALAGMAGAGTFQNIPYSTSNFSVMFNGSVQLMNNAVRSANNQSTNYTYGSQVGDVAQLVTVRFIDYDIPVTQESADFYANDDAKGNDVTNRSTGVYQGHLFTYTRTRVVEDGVATAKRTRFIIVSPREVIFISQITPFVDLTNSAIGTADQPQWIEFEDSLNIK